MSASYRIVGPPGTGKSTTIERYIGRAVALHGADAVAVASLTRAAAAELAGRGLPIPRGNAGTLHAHAYHALGRPVIAEDAKQVAVWNAEVQPAWRLSSGGALDGGMEAMDEWRGETEGDALLAHLNILRNRRVPEERWPASVAAFAQRWRAWQEREGSMDFTALIETALRDVPALPGVNALFLDEAQDCSALEMALAKQWGSACDIFVAAGDSDQAIYGWRGADPEAFTGMAAGDVRVLEQSYRLPAAVWDVAARWIERCSVREDAPFYPREADGEVLQPGLTMKDAAQVVGLAERYARQGTVMLLATCSYMLEGWKHELRGRSIPFHNPYRRKRGDWNPLGGGGQGVSARERLLSLLTEEWTREDIKRWSAAVSTRLLAKGWEERVPERGAVPAALLETLLQGDAAVWPWLVDGERLRSYEEHLLAARRPGMVYPLAVARKHGAAALKEAPRIVLGTVHSVKGGEADTVILAPDLSPNGHAEWNAGGVSRDAVRRVLYVGMTRARERLVLLDRATPFSVDWKE